jgi:hypothetical protein
VFAVFSVHKGRERGYTQGVGRVDSEPRGGSPAPAVTYTDADGQATDDPAAAVSGEIAEYDPHGVPRRRMRFLLLEQRALPWLPLSEAAFLLWVLVALIVAWLVVGLILGLV